MTRKGKVIVTRTHKHESTRTSTRTHDRKLVKLETRTLANGIGQDEKGSDLEDLNFLLIQRHSSCGKMFYFKSRLTELRASEVG